MTVDWGTMVAIGALMLALITVLRNAFDKSLTLREHIEFKNNVNSALEELRVQFRRDVDRVEHLVQVIIQTRPTVDQLEEAANSIRERVKELQDHIWEIAKKLDLK